MLYAVTPKETSFAHVRNVPDYLNEVSIDLELAKSNLIILLASDGS